MKKIFVITGLLVLAGIIFFKCKPLQNIGPFPLNSSCADTSCTSSDITLTGMIDYDLAIKLSADYAADSGKRYVWRGNHATDTLDATCIWFDLTKLKSYIEIVERLRCRAGCDANDRLGIRMYYIKYPDSITMKNYPALEAVPAAFANKHAVMLSATKWNGTRHVDINPWFRSTNCNFPPIHSPKGFVWMPLPPDGGGGGGGSESDLQNHGSLMPPPAGFGTFPTQ